MRSSAVGPDRAVDRSSAPPPRAANLYACHEVMGATACGPNRTQKLVKRDVCFGSIASFCSSADYFRSSPGTDIVRAGRHVSKVQIGDLAGMRHVSLRQRGDLRD